MPNFNKNFGFEFFPSRNTQSTSRKEMVDKTPLVEDSLLSGKQKAHHFISSNFDYNKINWLFGVVIFTILILIFRTSYLQIAKGNQYKQAAEQNRIRITEIPAPRGIIYDNQKNILVTNIPNFSLSFTPADLPKDEQERKSLAKKIAEITNLNQESLILEFNKQPGYSYQNFIIKEHIEYNEAIRLKILSADLPGISLQATSFRFYKTSPAFSHVLGYMGKVTEQDLKNDPNLGYNDYIGKSGLELYYNNFLQGKNGKKEIEVDSRGKEIKTLNIIDPVPGAILTTNLDSRLQNFLYDQLDDAMKKNKDITGASAIALNPNNGAVLALVSAPSYDNNKFTLGISQEEYKKIINNKNKPLFNRAISGEYPSGSTIKPLVALAALEDGIIDQNFTVLSTGGIKISKWFFPDWKAGGHGLTDIKKAIAESVNTFFYTIGGGYEDFTGLGVKKLTKYLSGYGLAKPTGIDLEGESSGFLPSKEWKEKTKKEKWYIGDTYHLSIGQGDLLVTPIQVAAYTAALANGGTLYQPLIAKSHLSSGKGQKQIKIEEKIINRQIGLPQNIEVIRQGLRQAVISGSARALQDLPVTSAGKTGTAQFGTSGKTHSWFTCFAPYDNPKIVITVMVENGGEGNETALPIAKRALEYWFTE